MRIDVYLVEHGFCKSRTQAARAIAEGRVTLNGIGVTKAALPVELGADIVVTQAETQYVSRAGYKLEAALRGFSLSVAGKTVLDIGASTGGFTDCALQHGAAFVYAVDVGTNQLDESLRLDPRVQSMEGVNARTLRPDAFPRAIDLAVMDVSFISQRLLYPALSALLPANGILIALIKPQFEVGREHIGKGGIVRDPDGKQFRRVLAALSDAAARSGLAFQAFIDSPIPGGDGNREYLAWFRRTGPSA